MRWKRVKKSRGVLQLTSISSKLRKEKKITPEFEVMLNNLTLEDIIALKLELATRVIHNTFIGIPIWYSLKNIAHDAVLKYVFSISKSKSEASLMLGLTPLKFSNAMYKFRTLKYFDDLIIKNKRKQKENQENIPAAQEEIRFDV